MLMTTTLNNFTFNLRFFAKYLSNFQRVLRIFLEFMALLYCIAVLASSTPSHPSPRLTPKL